MMAIAFAYTRENTKLHFNDGEKRLKIVYLRSIGSFNRFATDDDDVVLLCIYSTCFFDYSVVNMPMRHF